MKLTPHAMGTRLAQSKVLIDSGRVLPGSYINKKNRQRYEVLHLSLNSETGDPEVIYVDKDGQVWNRPYYLFVKKFERVSLLD